MYNIHVHQQHGNSEQARQRSSIGAEEILHLQGKESIKFSNLPLKQEFVYKL